ncbi:hypothetical protein L596_014306 [Steinernema carpocapsae]|uniref:Uncharacterized protein n=1 Tax=Steinernema carpocapsae TaxID=34508 RepID=A0A4U5NC33_STECR|nr:hypothetical protein L596_014306 [Steinernema carpocapsae]
MHFPKDARLCKVTQAALSAYLVSFSAPTLYSKRYCYVQWCSACIVQNTLPIASFLPIPNAKSLSTNIAP